MIENKGIKSESEIIENLNSGEPKIRQKSIKEVIAKYII